MNVYLIVFNSFGINVNYGVIDEIKIVSDGDWQHPVNDVWFITSEMTTSEIYSKLRPKMLVNDNLMIFLLNSSNEYMGYTFKEMWRWLNKRLKTNNND